MNQEQEMSRPILTESTDSTPSKGLVRDIIGIVSSPKEAFGRITKIGYWWGILIAILLVAGILHQIYHSELIDYTIRQMEEKASESGQNLQGVMDFYGNEAITRPMYSFFTLAGQVVFILIAAILYFFIGSVLFGGTAKFKQVWVVSCWAYIIEIIGLIFRTPLILIKHNMETGLNFGLIFTEGAVGPKLYKILSMIDIFGIWHFIVAGIGLAVIYKFSTTRGITISFISWLIVIAVSGALILIS
jgi:hypothetical protein